MAAKALKAKGRDGIIQSNGGAFRGCGGRKKREGEELRHLAQGKLWGKNRDAQRVFVCLFVRVLQSFSMCCMELTCSLSPQWLVVKSTSHIMRCNTKSVLGRVP